MNEVSHGIRGAAALVLAGSAVLRNTRREKVPAPVGPKASASRNVDVSVPWKPSKWRHASPN